MDKILDRKNKHLYLEGLRRELRNLEEQEKRLREQLDDVVALRQSKEKEMHQLADDKYTSDTLAKVYEQRRNTDASRKR